MSEKGREEEEQARMRPKQVVADASLRTDWFDMSSWTFSAPFPEPAGAHLHKSTKSRRHSRYLASWSSACKGLDNRLRMGR